MERRERIRSAGWLWASLVIDTVCRKEQCSFYRATACNATHGITMRMLSVCPSVRLSNAWFVTKRKNLCPHSYTTLKIIHPTFLTTTKVGGGPLVPEILGQTGPVRAKTPIFNRFDIRP